MGKKGQILSISSSKGGVGKTHLAVSLAAALARRDLQVLLIDADLGNGMVSDRLGLYPKCNLLHFFLRERNDLVHLIEKTPFGFFLIGGERGNFALANLNYLQKRRFLKNFMDVSRHFDYVLLDLASGINRQSIDFALLAEKTIVVTSPNDMISGYGWVKACFSRFIQLEKGLSKRIEGYKPRRFFKPHILVNNVTDVFQGQAVFEALEGAIENRMKRAARPFEIKMHYLGALFHNPRLFRKSEKRRLPVSLASVYSNVAYCVDSIAESICSPSPFRDLDNEKRLQYTLQILMEHRERIQEKVRQKVMDVSPVRIRLLQKRKFPRFEVNCPVSFLSFDRLSIGETVDIGLGGMKIKSRNLLFKGETYDFTLTMNGQTISPTGKVVNIENQPELAYGANVSFLRLPKDQESQLHGFLSARKS
ncbi:MAG: AAA family ATPase [Proteobacteria bacterium]|nr:AAA family ATPase [Pseudomonadota bacterium]